MRKATVSLSAAGALAVGLLLLTPAPAEGGGFGVVVGAPHATFTFGVGYPGYPAGYVYPPYARPVYYAPYGYGFWSPVSFCSVHRVRHAHFIPVHRFHDRWVVSHGFSRFGGHAFHGHFDGHRGAPRGHHRRY